MNPKIRNKIKEIFLPLQMAENLARKKFILSIILGILEARKIQLHEISLHIESEAKVESTERRLQAFFTNFSFDYDQIALILLFFMPKGKLTLCIDRTNWEFGSFECNVLMVTVRLHGVGIPLYWELLDNQNGNSGASARIDLVEKCVKLLGHDRIGMVIGDREFIGNKWLTYLKINKIPFCVRVPKSHLIELKNGRIYSIIDLLEISTERCYQFCMVDGIRCNVYLKKLENDEYLFLLGSEYSKNLGSIYRHRWSIEVCFQSLKGRGFDLEDSHLKSREKMKKMLVFLSLALALCVNLGIFLHEKVEKIKTKKHQYKSKSFFRHGLNTLRKILKGKEKKNEKHLLRALALLSKIIQLKTQLIDNQLLKKDRV